MPSTFLDHDLVEICFYVFYSDLVLWGCLIMSEEESGEDSDFEYHTPLSTRTRDLISRSSVSRAIDSSSYIERTLYTRVQTPVSVSRADQSSTAHPG